MATEFRLEAVKLKDEEKLCFSDADENNELGCLGYVRGDFGKSGNEFYTTWHEGKSESLMTDEMKSEIDNVVNTLYGDVLKSRNDMRQYCYDKDKARNFHSIYDRCWEFRILTNKCAMYLMCQVDHNDYSFYLHIYVKDVLFRELSKRRGLPRWCFSSIPSTGQLIIVRFGETGYYPCALETKDEVDEYNEKLGVTPAKREAMTAGSMFGWNAPCADPKNYDESGKPINKGEKEER